MFESNGVRSATSTFEEWQRALDAFTQLSLNMTEREDAKDAMVCTQQIIIACRAARKYQRDTIPLDQIITVRFGEEWQLAYRVFLEMNGCRV